MKRKNTQQSNPQQLLKNLQNRKSQYQKLSILTKQRKSRSKDVQKTTIGDCSFREPFLLASNQYNIKKQISISKQEQKSLSSAKNRSLKNIYCKTLILSPSQKKKSVFTPKSTKNQTNKYADILDMFTVPEESGLNQMIKIINKQLSNVLDRYCFDDFINSLFKRIKETIGLLIQTSVLDFTNIFSEQQKIITQDYNSIIQQNEFLNAKIQQLRYDNRMLEEDFKKILKQNQQLSIDICNKIKKQKDVNQLIYGLRMYGIDIDSFYIKMKHPEYDINQSQDTFTQKHLSKATI